MAAALLLCACPAASRSEDTIVLKNGDTLTGTILQQDARRVYFRSGTFGSVAIATRDIAEIRIETPGLGEVAVPAEAIAPDDATPEPPPEEPDAPPKKESAWSGQAGLALSVRQSNTLLRQGDRLVERDEEFETYRIYGNIDWKGEQNKLRWEWTYRYSRTDVRKYDEYLNVGQSYSHEFNPTYYTTAKTIYQRDFRRGIENEYLQTAELGVNWLNLPRVKLSVSAGGGYHKYDRIRQDYSDASGKFVLDQSFHWQMISSLAFFQKYNHLGNVVNYHFTLTAGLENKLIRDLFLRVEYRLERDTEINYSDRSYYDKALLTSILYKF